jgi:hypothetical protein
MLCGMDNDEKIRENRLRRMAARQGYKILKSRRRDPLATDYDTYRLNRGAVTTGPMTLDQVETWLISPKNRRPAD